MIFGGDDGSNHDSVVYELMKVVVIIMMVLMEILLVMVMVVVMAVIKVNIIALMFMW